MHPIIDEILINYKNYLSLDSKVLLIGSLQHVHINARMQSIYAYSTSRKYGYAFCESPSSSVDVNAIASDYFANTYDLSLQLAIMDSIWNTKVSYHSEVKIEGNSFIERDEMRSKLISDFIINKVNRLNLQPIIIMIGYFNTLYTQLINQGFKIYCKDAGLGMELPLSFNLENTLPQALLLSTASYLSRPDYKNIQQIAPMAGHSLLMAQTCHNMIELHLSSGFSTIFSESFPPYSLAESTLKVYER